MTQKPPFTRCETCELGGGCDRLGFCCRPRTSDYWRGQVQIATEALNVAAKNLNEANKHWKYAMDREAKT